jgi:hypothetical protein
MASNIPLNAITIKYTSGNEFVNIKTNAPYTGNYYNFNNKIYAGKEYNPSNPELVKSQNSNKLLNNKATSVYSVVSGVSSQDLQTPKINSLPNKGKGITTDTPRFFCRNTTQKDIIIKEIDETTYNSLKTNPLYQTTSIIFSPSPGYERGIPLNLNQAEKELPGITIFLAG